MSKPIRERSTAKVKARAEEDVVDDGMSAGDGGSGIRVGGLAGSGAREVGSW